MSAASLLEIPFYLLLFTYYSKEITVWQINLQRHGFASV